MYKLKIVPSFIVFLWSGRGEAEKNPLLESKYIFKKSLKLIIIIGSSLTCKHRPVFFLPQWTSMLSHSNDPVKANSGEMWASGPQACFLLQQLQSCWGQQHRAPQPCIAPRPQTHHDFSLADSLAVSCDRTRAARTSHSVSYSKKHKTEVYRQRVIGSAETHDPC